MESRGSEGEHEAGKHVDQDTDSGNINQQGPLMILSSGKVVGNMTGKGKEKWKEVRDNGTKKGNNEGQTITGKEIIPVDQGNVHQLPMENAANHRVQTNNQFSILEIEDGEQENNNDLALVPQSIALLNPTTTGKGNAKSPAKRNTPGRLNAAAPAYNPTSTGIVENNLVDLEDNSQKEKEKESTSQWVIRAFGVNNVTTNQTCQEITSQSLDTTAIEEQENYQDRVKFTEGRL